MKTIAPSIIRQLFLLLLILLLGSLIFKNLIPYLSGLLGAITLFVLLFASMIKLERRNWRPSLAALFLLIVSFLGILLPIAGVALMLGNKVAKGLKNSEKYVASIKDQIAGWEHHFGLELPSGMDTGKIAASITGGLQSLAGGTVNTILAIAIMYFLLYFMLKNHKDFLKALRLNSPIAEKHSGIIGKEITANVRSNAIGIPVVAIGQGIVSLVGFFIFGIEHPFFWAVIVTVVSVVPLVGAFLGIIPVFLIALSSGETFQAWGILLYGLIVVGTTDTLIRLYALKKLNNVHPLITVIGVIVGVPMFGFIGLIFGPLLISLFLLVVRIYADEYGDVEARDKIEI